jgi:hypothetical protein
MTIFGLILSLIYIFVYVLIIILWKGKDKAVCKSLIYLGLYLYGIFIIRESFQILPYFPDSTLFKEFVSDNLPISSVSKGVELYNFISTPLRWISFWNYEAFVVLQIAIFTVSIEIIRKSILGISNIYECNAKDIYTYYLISALYPAIILFIPITLREYMIVFGFALVINGVNNLKHKSYKLGVLNLLLGFIIFSSSRPQMAIIVPILILLVIESKFKKIAWLVLTIIIIPLIFNFLTTYKFNPEFFSLLRNSALNTHEGSEYTYGQVEWHTYFDVIVSLPSLLMQFIFSPFPIISDNNPFTSIAYTVDGIYVLFIYYLSYKFMIQYNCRIIIYVVILMVIFSIWEFDIGGAVRHRLPLILMLLPLASIILSTKIGVKKCKN